MIIVAGPVVDENLAAIVEGEIAAVRSQVDGFFRKGRISNDGFGAGGIEIFLDAKSKSGCTAEADGA